MTYFTCLSVLYVNLFGLNTVFYVMTVSSLFSFVGDGDSRCFESTLLALKEGGYRFLFVLMSTLSCGFDFL